VPSEQFKPLTAIQSASDSVSQLLPGGRSAGSSSTASAAAAPLSNRQVPADRGSFSLAVPAHQDGWSTDDSDSESDALVGSKKRPHADLHRRYHLLSLFFSNFGFIYFSALGNPSLFHPALGGRGRVFFDCHSGGARPVTRVRGMETGRFLRRVGSSRPLWTWNLLARLIVSTLWLEGATRSTSGGRPTIQRTSNGLTEAHSRQPRAHKEQKK
jgi:hypothetical protein